MSNTSSMERLTFLLGVCAAIIGWGVNHISTSLDAPKAIVYDVSESRVSNDIGSISLDLRNIGQAFRSSGGDIFFVGEPIPGKDTPGSSVPRSCDLKSSLRSVNMTPVRNFSPRGGDDSGDSDAVPPSEVGSTSRRESANSLRHEFGSLPVGGGIIFNVQYSRHCNVEVSIDFDNPEFRLLKYGVESFLIEYRFLIFVFLVFVFSVVFFVSYVMSYLKAIRSEE